MPSSILTVIAWFAGITFAVATVYALHRWLIYLEERGYIYYRTKSKSGTSSVLFEMDKLTRPSVEHIQQAQEMEVESQRNDGE